VFNANILTLLTTKKYSTLYAKVDG